MHTHTHRSALTPNYKRSSGFFFTLPKTLILRRDGRIEKRSDPMFYCLFLTVSIKKNQINKFGGKALAADERWYDDVASSPNQQQERQHCYGTLSAAMNNNNARLGFVSQ